MARCQPRPEAELSPLERAHVKELEDENRKLRLENEFLKKASLESSPDATVSARCALIEAEKATYKIVWMCGLPGVARSAFYAWRARVETRARQLGSQLIAERSRSRGRVHGCRRAARDLNDAGHEVSVGTVASLMRQVGLKAV